MLAGCTLLEGTEANSQIFMLTRYELRLQLKSGDYVSFDGFPKSQFESLKTYFTRHLGISIRLFAVYFVFLLLCSWLANQNLFLLWAGFALQEDEPGVKGWNWGEIKFVGPSLAFLVENKAAFEINLSTVSNSSFQKNEALIEFHKASVLACSVGVQSLLCCSSQTFLFF